MVNKKREAFTLVELMLVVAIIGILATLIGPPIVRRMKQVNVTATKATMSNLKAALLDYKQDIGHFPTKREGGLDALVRKPGIKGTERWDGPYLSGQTEAPTDKWGFPFEYNVGTEIKNKDRYKYFEIISYGADGQPGGEGENAELDAGE